nr:MAG TPA: hypothetical protein [Bacteriophage sp.]
MKLLSINIRSIASACFSFCFFIASGVMLFFFTRLPFFL